VGTRTNEIDRIRNHEKPKHLQPNVLPTPNR
jgi:hypothetical protein